MEMTWAEIIALILLDAGVIGTGQTAQASQITNMKARLNMMLAQWMRRRWLVYHLVEHSITCDGSLFYTIGVGGDINTTRPDQVNAAFARQTTQAVPNQPDYSMMPIMSYEEYSQIGLKRLNAGPSWGYFYDSGWPLGKIYPYPLMNNNYELHVLVKDVLSSIGDITAQANLPPEYYEAIYACGMQRARGAFGLPPRQSIDAMAKAALETIRTANFQVGTLNMPGPVQGYGGYNALSDSFGPTYR